MSITHAPDGALGAHPKRSAPRLGQPHAQERATGRPPQARATRSRNVGHATLIAHKNNHGHARHDRRACIRNTCWNRRYRGLALARLGHATSARLHPRRRPLSRCTTAHGLRRTAPRALHRRCGPITPHPSQRRRRQNQKQDADQTCQHDWLPSAVTSVHSALGATRASSEHPSPISCNRHGPRHRGSSTTCPVIRPLAPERSERSRTPFPETREPNPIESPRRARHGSTRCGG